MMKTFTAIAAFAAAFGIVTNANASTISGRVTAFSPTSMSVQDKELVTVGINKDTVFTKLVVAKPWQEDVALTFGAVRVGAFVVMHVPDNSGFVANWVQVGNAPIAYSAVTPAIGYTDEALKHLAAAADRRAHPTASESKRPGSVDTAAHCERLAALGRGAVITPALRSADAVNADAAKHRAEAATLRANPTASESKRPGSVDTAAYHDRLANELEK